MTQNTAELPADFKAQETYPRWEFRGIAGWGEKPPPLTNTEQGTAVILANAACIWDDIRKLPAHDAVIAVNDIGAYYRHKVHHWVSYHDLCLQPFLSTYVIHTFTLLITRMRFISQCRNGKRYCSFQSI